MLLHYAQCPYAQLSSRALRLVFSLLPYFAYASSEGSGETVRVRMLILAIAGGQCEKFQNLTCCPSVLLPAI